MVCMSERECDVCKPECHGPGERVCVTVPVCVGSAGLARPVASKCLCDLQTKKVSKCRTVAPCGPGMSPQRWQRRGRQSLSACPARRAPAARAPESPRQTAGAPGDERAIGARMMSMSRASRRVSGRGAGRGAARRSRRHRHRSARWHASTARRRRRMRQGVASAAPSLRAQPLASRLSVRRCTRTCAGSRRSLRQRRQF